MFQNIRKQLEGWLAWVVIGVIAVPLALSFINSDGGVGGTNYAVRVNGEEIPSVEFQRVFQDRLVAQQQAARGQLPPQMEEQLKRETLDGLVLNRAVTQYVRDTGFRVSNERIAEFIRTAPVFQVAGQFSKASYEALLAAQGISPATFEKDQRGQLMIRQLQDGLTESSFFTPAEFRRVIALDQERRDVAYVLLDPVVLGAAITVSDADVQSYYVANASQFQSPESVNLEYIEVALDGMARDYAPDEATLHKAYEADPTRFRTAEERQARHILISVDAGRTDAAARALADEVAKKLGEGGDFAKLAAQYSSDAGSASRGGDLGFAAKGVYVAPFEKALFALQPGQTSAPVKTEFGYHIIRLEALRPGAEQSFDEVRPQLVDEVRRQKAQDEFFAMAERLDDLALESPTSLEPVAKDTGLSIRRVEGFTRAGGGPFGANSNLISAVFSEPVLEGGENTPLIEIDEKRAIVARVAEHKLPSPRPLEEVRGEITERLRTLRAAAEAKNRGEAILKQQDAGQDLGKVASASGLKLVEAGPLMRRSSTVPPELLAAIFRAPKPADGKPVVQGMTLGNGAYAVFQLRTVVAGEPEMVPREQRDERKRFLAQRTAVAETEALAAQLRDSAQVVVAPNLFKAPDDDQL